MARESFDKEIQFLRILALAGGAYNRQQLADRLGISVHTYDKTLRNLKIGLNRFSRGSRKNKVSPSPKACAIHTMKPQIRSSAVVPRQVA